MGNNFWSIETRKTKHYNYLSIQPNQSVLVWKKAFFPFFFLQYFLFAFWNEIRILTMVAVFSQTFIKLQLLKQEFNYTFRRWIFNSAFPHFRLHLLKLFRCVTFQMCDFFNYSITFNSNNIHDLLIFTMTLKHKTFKNVNEEMER